MAQLVFTKKRGENSDSKVHHENISEGKRRCKSKKTLYKYCFNLNIAFKKYLKEHEIKVLTLALIVKEPLNTVEQKKVVREAKKLKE